MVRGAAWCGAAVLAVCGAAAQADETPRTAVMSAFAPELEALLAATEDAETVVRNNVAFTTGTLEGRPVVLLLSGISMVNAAMTTQMVLENYAVEEIVFSGIAGGVDPSLDIGDVVVAARWSPYFDVHIAREEADGALSTPGYFTPTLPAYQARYPRGVSLFVGGAHDTRTQMWFDVDPALLARAERAASAVTLEACAGETCLSEAPSITVGGSGVSGTAFVDNAAFGDYVFETFEARVLDMESAAVAQVAHTNGVPFIAFRSLSDLAGGGDGENEIETFFALAAANAARTVRAYLRTPSTP